MNECCAGVNPQECRLTGGKCKGEKLVRCRKKRKSSEMFLINSRYCELSDCQHSALWREATKGKKRVCQDHREKGVAYSQIAAICAKEGCFEEPCFGIAASGKLLYCAKHKTDDMAEVRPRNCATPGCGKSPSYGVGGKREMCRDHKAKGMTYAALTCESPLCNKNPSFALRGETRRRFCKLHAEPHMVNVYYKYCGMAACPERASFENGDKLRCLAHIEAGMKPRNNICQVAGGGCTRQSSYGPDGGKPVVCTVHREPGMVQVRTKKCRHLGCEKIPSYGYPCMSREYCKPHALEGMIYSAGGRCRFRGCRAVGVFNRPGVRGASFCQKHKEDGMVDIQPTKCEEGGCNYAASFGDPLERKKFCSRHKRPGMVRTKNTSAATISSRTPSSATDSISITSGNASSGGGKAGTIPNASASETMFADAARATSIDPSTATPGAVVSGGTTLLSSSCKLGRDPLPMANFVLSGRLTGSAVSSTSTSASAEAITTLSAISESRMPPLPACCTSTSTSSATAASGVALSTFDPIVIRATRNTKTARGGKEARKNSAGKTAASAGGDFHLPAIPAAASTTAPATAIGLSTAATADHDVRRRATTTIPATPAFTAIPHFTQILAGDAAKPQAQASGFGSSSAHVNPAALSRHPGSLDAAAAAASGAASMPIHSRWAWLVAGLNGGGNLPAATSIFSANTAAECGRALPASATFNTPVPIATLQKLQSGESAGITLPSQDSQPVPNTAATLTLSGACLASVSEGQGRCSPTSTAERGATCSTRTREPGLVQYPVSTREVSGSDPPSSSSSTRRASDRVRKPGFGGVICSGGGRTGTGTSTNYMSALSSSTTSANQVMPSSSAVSSIRGTTATAKTMRDYYLVDASVGSAEPYENGVKVSKSTVEEERFLSSLLGMMDPADPQTARVRGAMMARLRSITNKIT